MFKNCFFKDQFPSGHPTLHEPSIHVEAQKDFTLGPNKDVIIKKGERFFVHLGKDDLFVVTLSIGSFGFCSINPQEWSLVS